MLRDGPAWGGDPAAEAFRIVNKYDLARSIYELHGGLSQAECVRIVDTILEVVKGRLARGEKVLLSGFGCFRVKRRKERRGVNPKTGERIMIAGRRAVSFTPSRHLRLAP